MFLDIAPSEFLFTAIVAVVVIGPKDLPMALRTAGRWMGKMRRVSGHFRSGIETMIREAELEEMEKKWREQNDAIMKAHPEGTVPELTGAPPEDWTKEPHQPAPGAEAAPFVGPVAPETHPEQPLASPPAPPRDGTGS